jgi:poly-gamma-glutamate capsule biosynthesis protein CapA/YwtB (metallophosphatase superfamily)
MRCKALGNWALENWAFVLDVKKYSIILFLSFHSHANAQDTTRLSLLFAGDIMGHDSQIASAYDATINTYDYTSCYRFVKPYLESVDIAIGNLELTLAGAPYKGYPAFSSPDQLVLTLKDAGFDVLVTANNHSCDRGKRGIERTIEMLDSLGVPHTGTFTDEAARLNDYPLMLTKNGFKLALLNYTYGTNGIAVPSPTIVNPIDTVQMVRDIAKAKRDSADVVVSFMHWGSEYQSQPNAYQKKITRFLFDRGVSVIIGAHPHVLQPMEFDSIKQQLVVYSLGNFVSGQRDRYKNGGAMVRMELQKVRNDSITTTVVDNVQYILQYVHRDAKRDYIILPVPSFENDTTGLIKDETSKLLFKTFVEDSRVLLNKKNKQVAERRTVEALKPEEVD